MITSAIRTHPPKPDVAGTVRRLSLCSEQGSTLVEFALVLPIALMVLFGALQCALALFSFCNATYACSVAVRYASLHSMASPVPATTNSVESAARALLWVAPADASVNTVWSPGNTVGGTVSVSVRETLPFAIPFTSLKSFSVGSTTQRLIIR